MFPVLATAEKLGGSQSGDSGQQADAPGEFHLQPTPASSLWKFLTGDTQHPCQTALIQPHFSPEQWK